MYSENGILIDFDQVRRVITEADVFALAFAHIPERLLVDARSNAEEGPLVQVVEPAGSVQQRLAWLYRRRPSLGQPKSFSLVAWPHSPKLLVDSGVWDRIRRQAGADGDPQVEVQCSLALKQLENLDHEAILATIRGEGWATLWPPQKEQEA